MNDYAGLRVPENTEQMCLHATAKFIKSLWSAGPTATFLNNFEALPTLTHCWTNAHRAWTKAPLVRTTPVLGGSTFDPSPPAKRVLPEQIWFAKSSQTS